MRALLPDARRAAHGAWRVESGVPPPTRRVHGVSGLPAASLPLCGDTWVRGHRCCGPGHLPLLLAGALGSRGCQPPWRRGWCPAGLSQLWRRGVLLLRPRQPDCPVCARVVVGARARPAQSGRSCVLCPRPLSPLQTGAGSLAGPRGRWLGGARVGRGAALREGSRRSVFESTPEDGPRAEQLPGRSQLPGLPPAGAALGGKGWPLLLYLGDPHIRPSCPVSPPSLGVWPFRSSHRRLTSPAGCFEQAQSRAVPGPPGTGRGGQGAARSPGVVLQVLCLEILHSGPVSLRPEGVSSRYATEGSFWKLPVRDQRKVALLSHGLFRVCLVWFTTCADRATHACLTAPGVQMSSHACASGDSVKEPGRLRLLFGGL